MRLTGIKAMVCAAVVALVATSNASAWWWPNYYGYGGWYGGYWPAYSYYGSYYYPSYWGSYYYPSYYSYYTPYTYPTYYSYAPYTYTYPNYVTPSTLVAAPASSEYRSFYPPDSALNGPAPNEADVRVVTAPDAQLWFNGTPMTKTGSVRTFNTPDLQPGQSYSYQVKVRWMQNGQPVERTRTVAVAAGQTVDVDLTPANLLR